MSIINLGYNSRSQYNVNRNADILLKLNEHKGTKGYQLESLTKDIKIVFQSQISKIKLLKPLRKFCLQLLQAGNGFSIAHIYFLRVVIQSRMYKQAVSILEWPFVSVGQLKSDEILQYLYYGGIIWTVLEEYKSASEFFGFINRIQHKSSNIKIDAKKKLTLVKLLLGQKVYDRQQSQEYAPIIAKLQKGEELTKQQQSTIKQDGNWPLIQKLRDVILLNQLTDMSLIYNRIPISSMNAIFAEPEIISRINKIQHTYRYDPRSQCVIFQAKKTNIQKSISKTVKTYLQILAEEKNIRQSHQKEEREFKF